MKRFSVGLAAALILIAASAACTGMRRVAAPQGAAPESPPPAITESAAATPESAEPNPPASSNENPQPRESNPVIPTCVPAETKSKPKTRPKPKSVLREPPAQPPSIAIAAEPGPDGTVDAQVRSMPVSVVSILGKRVQSPKGEDLGRVVDVLADANGRVRIAIVDFGGFLGVGNRRIAVEWPLLRFNPDQRDPPSLLLSLSREKLQAAPEYKDNPRPQTLMVPPAAAPASAPAAAASTPDDNKK